MRSPLQPAPGRANQLVIFIFMTLPLHYRLPAPATSSMPRMFHHHVMVCLGLLRWDIKDHSRPLENSLNLMTHTIITCKVVVVTLCLHTVSVRMYGVCGQLLCLRGLCQQRRGGEGRSSDNMIAPNDDLCFAWPCRGHISHRTGLRE